MFTVCMCVCVLIRTGVFLDIFYSRKTGSGIANALALNARDSPKPILSL